MGDHANGVNFRKIVSKTIIDNIITCNVVVLIYLLLTTAYHFMCVKYDACHEACNCCEGAHNYVPMEAEPSIIRTDNLSDVELGSLSFQEESA